MSVVHHGVRNGEKIIELFGGDAKKKIYLYWSRGGIFGMSHCCFFLIYTYILLVSHPLLKRCTPGTKRKEVGNRPFPNYLWPLFQSESWCSSFHMKISFHSHANEN